MLLSEAIVLGDTLKKCDPGEWITLDGSCGCALGGALLAAGVTPEEFNREYYASPIHHPEWFKETPCIISRWSWLESEHVENISKLYYEVNDGNKTIEDVAAYVRSVEPREVPANFIPEMEEQKVSQ